MNVRLTHIDGKLPNLALMKLAAYHREQGDDVVFTREVRRGILEPAYDRVYGSAIFAYNRARVDVFRREFPEAIVGGTGSGESQTVEDVLALERYEHYDYAPYPEFTASLGFTMRGCRLACKFCVVPSKEGRARATSTIAQIYRGAPYPRHLHLLDNDFFGQPREAWRAHLDDIRAGDFRVCFNQGINVRLIDAEIASELARTPFYDDAFKERRLYTAWDNLRDEAIFLRGIGHLIDAGIKPRHILVFMLIGYDPAETWERIFRRFEIMRELGLCPYPMVFDNARKDLKVFQRWVIRRYYKVVPWDRFRVLSQTEREALHHFAVARERQLEFAI